MEKTPEREYPFPRYLSAKKSVDDRALNRPVWQALQAALPISQPGAPLRVLEIGAGIGTMLERMIDTGLLTFAHYTALDQERENIIYARQRLTAWGEKRGLAAHWQGRHLALEGNGCQIEASFVENDLFSFVEQVSGSQSWDLLVAHAFLDLMDLPSTLLQVFSLLATDRLTQPVFYFTINFDGVTILEPVIEAAFDEQVIHLYHRTMDERRVQGKPSGDSRTGRRMFHALRQSGASLVAAGASDWVVFADQFGNYPQDEAYFLHFIIHTMDQALRGHPELDAERFQHWIAARHAQVERGELVLIAHQLDFVGHPSLKGSA